MQMVISLAPVSLSNKKVNFYTCPRLTFVKRNTTDNAYKRISEPLDYKSFWGGHAPRPPYRLAPSALENCLVLFWSLATALIEVLQYKEHELTHTGVKRNTCKCCNKSFLRSSTCRWHERTHTRLKPHQCKYCDEWFIGCQIARDMDVYSQGYDHINASIVINVLSSQNIARSMNVLTHERNLRSSKYVISATLSCQMLRSII